MRNNRPAEGRQIVLLRYLLKNRQYRVGAVIGAKRGSPAVFPVLPRHAAAKRGFAAESTGPSARRHSFRPRAFPEPESSCPCRRRSHQVAEPLRFMTFRFWLYRNAIPTRSGKSPVSHCK